MLHAALQEPNAQRVIERLLRGTAECFTDPCRPAGCLVVQGALACGETAQSVKEELCARRAAGEAKLRERLERAKSEGDLSADADPATLARYLATVAQGMSVQAASGASRAELLAVADMVVKSLPKSQAAPAGSGLKTGVGGA